MPISFDHLISPSGVAEIGPDEIRKLVSRLAPSLKPPAAGSQDDAAVLAKWLGDVPPEEHSDLFEYIHAIVHVLAQEDLQQILSARQIPLPPKGPLGAVVAEIAIKSPETLWALSAQASVSEAHSAKAFVTYRRPGGSVYSSKLTSAKRQLIEKSCRSALEKSGNGRYCRVWDSPDGHNTAVVISYGAGLRSRRMISRADSAELQTNRAPRDAVVLVTPDCHEIRVSAGTGREREIFVSTVGAVLCGENTKFDCAEAFDLEVICAKHFAQKLAALRGDDFTRASVVELVLIRRDELGTRISLRAKDVLELAREEGLDLAQYEPKRAILEFVPAERRGRRRWRIDLKGADTRRCTAPWSQEALDRILEELGILRRPR
jgi:hypothetical protein